MLNANIDKHLADLKEYIEDAKQAHLGNERLAKLVRAKRSTG